MTIVYDIFISYSHDDKSFVERLIKDLRRLGINVWLDEKDIKVGDSLTDKIRKGIDSSRYFGIILSSNSISSEWVKKETDIAINSEIKDKRVKVLPILLESCNLPWFLEGKYYADFSKSYYLGFSKLLDVLNPSQEGFFIIKNVIDILDLFDQNGHKANIIKKWYIENIRGELSHWVYCLKGTGKIKAVDSNPRTNIVHEKCDIQELFKFKFDKPISKGENFKFEATFLAVDSFLENREWYNVYKPNKSCMGCIVTNGLIEKHQIKIIFPERRPFKSFKGVIRKGSDLVESKNKPITMEENNRKVILWEIDCYSDNTLWWDW